MNAEFREKIIVAMAIELENHKAFEGDAIEAGVWATRCYDAAVKAEYVARFTAHMLKKAGQTFDDGTSIELYAHDMAPRYLKDYPDEAPEESAEADLDYQ